MLVRLIRSYLEFSSFDTSSIKWRESLSLPAMTLCSTNFINNTLFHEHLKTLGKENIGKDLDNLMEAVLEYDGSINIVDHINYTELDEILDFEEEHGNIAFYYSNNFHSYVSNPDSHDYIFDGRKIKFGNASKTTFSTELGYCLELNDNSSLIQHTPGMLGGLSMDLDIHVSTYLPSTKHVGFILFVRGTTLLFFLNRKKN